MVAVGLRGGPFVGEVEWAYLSFFEPDTTSDGVQRVGVTLRADVLRRYTTHCMFRYACTRGSSLWVDAGVAERFGQWLLDAHDIAPAQSREPEAHVSLGIELDNQIRPMRNGWQLGVRFAVSPRGVGRARRAGRAAECETTGDGDDRDRQGRLRRLGPRRVDVPVRRLDRAPRRGQHADDRAEPRASPHAIAASAEHERSDAPDRRRGSHSDSTQHERRRRERGRARPSAP